MERGIKGEDIIVMGRSIGSGPATFLASRNKIGVLILMSAYTSIKDAARDLVGPYLTKFVKQRFENDKNMQNIECPTFIIHGMEDEIIPW